MDITKRMTTKLLQDLDVEIFILVQQFCWSKKINEQITIKHIEYCVTHNDHYTYHDRYFVYVGSVCHGFFDVDQ